MQFAITVCLKTDLQISRKIKDFNQPFETLKPIAFLMDIFRNPVVLTQKKTSRRNNKSINYTNINHVPKLAK